MTPGPSEEAGKVAIGVIDALRSNPIFIVLIILNALFFALIYFSVSETRQMDGAITKMLLEQHSEAQQLLAKCVSSQ